MKLLLAAVVSGGAGALIVSSAAASALNNPCLGPGSRAATRVLVQKCNASNPFQQWTFSSNSSSSSTAAAAAGVGGGGAVTLRSDSSSCLSVLDFATAQESLLVVTPCHPQDKTPGHRNQEFSYNASDQVIEVTGDAQGMVVDLSNYGVDGYGEKVWIYPPTGSNNQQWAYDASTGLLHSQTTRAPAGQDDMCIDASPPKDFSHMPWCNVSLPVDERVADMVSRMTLAEKIPNLDTPGAPIPSLGLDQYVLLPTTSCQTMLADRLAVVLRMSIDRVPERLVNNTIRLVGTTGGRKPQAASPTVTRPQSLRSRLPLGCLSTVHFGSSLVVRSVTRHEPL